MARPRNDGTAPRQPNRRNLTELFVRKIRPDAAPFNVWDEKERGLVLRVHPTGRRAFKLVYSRGRPRWYHIGDVGLSDARRMAARIKLAVAEGKDPAAERRAERGAGTFADVGERYFQEHARKVNVDESAIFTCAVKMDGVAVNPCIGVYKYEEPDRARVLSDSELPKFSA